MSRMIDADEFENRMYHEAFERDSDMQKWDSGCWIRYRLFEKVLRGQPTVTPEPHWIPVTERLPEDNVYVLLTIRRMDDSYNHVPFISTGYISWNHQCWWCAHDGNCKDANIDVLAWMPLPEPFKGVMK